MYERPPKPIAGTVVYAQSYFNLASSSTPSCIKVIHPSGSSKIGTFGGLIKITAGDGNVSLFGITAGHIFANNDFLDGESVFYNPLEEDSDDHENSSTDDDTDDAENSSTDDEEAAELDLGFPDDDEFSSRQDENIDTGTKLVDDGIPKLSWIRLGRLQEVSVNAIDKGMNFDWALITIDDLNFYCSMAGTDPIHKMQKYTVLKGPLELPNQRRSNHVVTLCGGTSGTQGGILYTSKSYLQRSPGKTLVRTYTLTLSDHKGKLRQTILHVKTFNLRSIQN